MNVITSSATVLCISLFTASIIKIIAPQGRTEKVIRIAISFFVILCIATCVKSVIGEVNISKSEYINNSESISSEIDRNVLKVTGDYLVEYTESLLTSENIDARKIKVTVDADENGVINITDISIYLSKDKITDKQKVIDLLETDLNVTPKIIIGE